MNTKTRLGWAMTAGLALLLMDTRAAAREIDHEDAPCALVVPEGDGIGGSVDRIGEDSPPLAVRAAPLWTSRLAPLTRVRVQTVPPPTRRRGDVREDRDWVMIEDPSGRPTIFSRKGKTIEGRIAYFEEDAVVLAVGGDEKVRVRTEHIARFDVRQGGSTAMGVVGGLAGAAAGLLGTGLVCATGSFCEGVWPFWIGTAVGAAVGAAAGGLPEWTSVTLARKDQFSIELQPTRKGASLNAALRF